MDTEARKKVLARLNRVAGQVAGVQRMIGEGRYCVDVLHQIAAIRSALDRLGVELLTRHLETCVVGHGEGTEHRRANALSRQQLLAEVQTTLSQFLK